MAAVSLLLVLHATLLAWGGLRHSITLDEVGHLAAGMSHWKLGRFDLYCVNPHLVRFIAAIPVCIAGAEIDLGQYGSNPAASRSEFPIGIHFIEANRNRSFWYFTLARFACLPFSILGGWICFRWARELYGAPSGVLAALLWCFCPNILAHGQLITPDVGASALGIASGYCFWRWLRTPTWGNSVIAGLVLGLVELTKATWVLLFLLWPLLWLLWQWPRRRILGPGTWRREGCQLAVIVLMGLYVLNLGYAFGGSFTRLGNYRFLSRVLAGDKAKADGGSGGNRFAGTWLGSMPVPLPVHYVTGIDIIRTEFDCKLWSYLRGEWRLGGWWYYYLYALLIKVPLGTWVLVVLAAVAPIFRQGYVERWRDELVLLAPILVMLILVSSQTGFNHHLRYMLPVFPFAFVWMSKMARAFSVNGTKTAMVVAVATTWSLGSSLWICPHSLSYFNESVGGPRRGHLHLDYSNIDWGQDLLYLKRWLAQHPEVKPLGLAYSIDWFVNPQTAGIEYTLPPAGPEYNGSDGPKSPEERGPLPGWYAISVHKLIDGQKRYAYFQRFEPVARVGYSLCIYHIELEQANRVREDLGLPKLGPASGVPEEKERHGR